MPRFLVVGWLIEQTGQMTAVLVYICRRSPSWGRVGGDFGVMDALRMLWRFDHND